MSFSSEKKETKKEKKLYETFYKIPTSEIIDHILEFIRIWSNKNTFNFYSCFEFELILP